MGEEVACQLGIFCRDAQPSAMGGGVSGTDIVEIGHGGDVYPVLRHRDHHIGKAETHRRDKMHAVFQFGRGLAQQIFAGDAQMDIAFQQGRGDFAGR